MKIFAPSKASTMTHHIDILKSFLDWQQSERLYLGERQRKKIDVAEVVSLIH